MDISGDTCECKSKWRLKRLKRLVRLWRQVEIQNAWRDCRRLKRLGRLWRQVEINSCKVDGETERD